MTEQPPRPSGGEPGRPARPGIIPLAPQDAGDLVGAGFRFVRTCPVTVLVPILVYSAVLVAVQFGLQGETGGVGPTSVPGYGADPFGPFSLWSGLGIAAVTALIYPPLLGIALAALRPAVVGRRIGPGQAWQAARPHLGALYVVVPVTALIGLVPVLIIGFVGAPLWESGVVGAVVAVLLVVAGYVVMIYLTVLLTLAPAAVVVEGLPAVDALHRSRELVTGSWWRCFGVQLLCGIAVAVAGLAIAIPVIAVAVAVGAGGLRSGAVVVGGIGIVLYEALAYAVLVGTTALLYQDQRIRREGLDPELASAAHGG
ncbi:hypothetical protein [Pseudonocardia phyllosphaerae]|uniref:hypothetical protein n=1 Tax=Pseudonocardia phyllosphaerae TaxID=3390502 RepID=UPI00397AE3AF